VFISSKRIFFGINLFFQGQLLHLDLQTGTPKMQIQCGSGSKTLLSATFGSTKFLKWTQFRGVSESIILGIPMNVGTGRSHYCQALCLCHDQLISMEQIYFCTWIFFIFIVNVHCRTGFQWRVDSSFNNLFVCVTKWKIWFYNFPVFFIDLSFVCINKQSVQ